MKRIGRITNSVVVSLVCWALLLGAIGGGAYLLVQNNRAPISRIYSAVRAGAIAWRFDRLYDSLPDKPIEIGKEPVTQIAWTEWSVATNDRDLKLIVEEALPYYHYEFNMNPVRPKLVAFLPFPGTDAFHVLGRASCTGNLFVLNYQYVNEYSPRHRDDSLLPTAVHELGHVQGICSWMGSDGTDMEARNQLATWEILAAMANHGNAYAVKPLIGELRDAALDYTRALARQSGNERFYTAFVDRFIYTDITERLRAEKSRRYWADHEEHLDRIIISYGMRPWYMMEETLATEDALTTASPFYPNTDGRIKLDDLRYFLRHLPQQMELGGR